MKAMLKTKYNNIKPNDFNSSISFELSFCGTTLYSEDSFHVDFIDVDTRIFECVSNYPIDCYLYKGIKITTNFDSKKMILDCVKERKEQNIEIDIEMVI
jgi:hypothetical protein